jgi:hypothetical protein
VEGVEGAEVIEELELVLLKESVGVAAVVVVEGAGEVYARVSVAEKYKDEELTCLLLTLEDCFEKRDVKMLPKIIVLDIIGA